MEVALATCKVDIYENVGKGEKRRANKFLKYVARNTSGAHKA